MIRYTTPTITLEVDADLSASDIYVSLVQGSKEKVVKNPSYSVSSGKTTLTFTFTQEESASFNEFESIHLQVNWITAGGTRNATEIATFNSFRNLLDEVIAYGN